MEIKANDLVKVVDGSYNRDLNTNKERNGIDELFKDNIGLVIANKSTEVYVNTIGKPVLMNLIISFSGGIVIACAENCVKKL
jgi:hypothetical protein